MTLLFLLLGGALGGVLGGGSWAAEASPVCDRYLALERKLGCGPDNYLREFGHRYCVLFEKERPEYTAEGKAFLDRVKVCLAEDMAQAPGPAGCGDTRARGLAGHERCYPASGYCALPWGDRLRIVAEAVKEFRHADFLRTAFATLGHCYGKR